MATSRARRNTPELIRTFSPTPQAEPLANILIQSRRTRPNQKSHRRSPVCKATSSTSVLYNADPQSLEAERVGRGCEMGQYDQSKTTDLV
jgi:hypothetical protein